MRKTSTYARKRAHSNNHGYSYSDTLGSMRLLRELEPFTASELSSLTLPPRMAYQAISTGQARPGDFDTLAAVVNVTLIRAERIELVGYGRPDATPEELAEVLERCRHGQVCRIEPVDAASTAGGAGASFSNARRAAGKRGQQMIDTLKRVREVLMFFRLAPPAERPMVIAAIKEIDAAIERLERQEPVARLSRWGTKGESSEGYTVHFLKELPPDGSLFYTTPPAAVQPEQEPVAWRYTISNSAFRYVTHRPNRDLAKEYPELEPIPLYTTPPAQPADKSRMDIADAIKSLCANGELPDSFEDVADWIAEAKQPGTWDERQKS